MTGTLSVALIERCVEFGVCVCARVCVWGGGFNYSELYIGTCRVFGGGAEAAVPPIPWMAEGLLCDAGAF